MLEEDVAFSSMAQDEIGHARLFYSMLAGAPGRRGRRGGLRPPGRDGFRNAQFAGDAAHQLGLHPRAPVSLRPVRPVAAGSRWPRRSVDAAGRGHRQDPARGEVPRHARRGLDARAWPRTRPTRGPGWTPRCPAPGPPRGSLFEPLPGEDLLRRRATWPPAAPTSTRRWQARVGAFLRDLGVTVPTGARRAWAAALRRTLARLCRRSGTR